MQISEKKRQMIFINIVISCIASSMLATALTAAMPAMVKDLHISIAQGQWLTSGYSLAMGIMMPLTAFLITRFPTRKLFLCGQILFLLGLVFCAVAPNFPLVMAARILQAVGSGIISAMSQVIILSIYPIEKRGTAMGWYGLSVSAAPIVAPSLAGIIVDIFNWRAIFYIAIGIMAIALVWAISVFDNILENVKTKFDILSFIISIFAFGGITLGVGNLASYGLLGTQAIVPLVIGAITGVLFVWRQLHLQTPFLDLRVLKNRNFTLSVICSMLLYLVMMGSSMLMPVYAQSILGYSATISGLLVLPGSLVMALTSPLVGKIYDKLGMRLLFIIGGICLLIGCMGMSLITRQTSIWVACGLNTLRNAAISCLMMPLVTFGISGLQKEQTAHGTALLNTMRTIAGAIGMSVFVGIMTSVSSSSVALYGENASVHGLNISFVWMALVMLVFTLIGVFYIKKKFFKETETYL